MIYMSIDVRQESAIEGSEQVVLGAEMVIKFVAKQKGLCRLAFKIYIRIYFSLRNFAPFASLSAGLLRSSSEFHRRSKDAEER
jgi:hypothetical protein